MLETRLFRIGENPLLFSTYSPISVELGNKPLSRVFLLLRYERRIQSNGESMTTTHTGMSAIFKGLALLITGHLVLARKRPIDHPPQLWNGKISKIRPKARIQAQDNVQDLFF